MLTVSDQAADRINKLLESEAKKLSEWGLRVGRRGRRLLRPPVPPRHHQGARRATPSIEHLGVKVFVDPKSLQYVEGSRVDYSDALTGAGFKIVNPNEKNSLRLRYLLLGLTPGPKARRVNVAPRGCGT